MGYPSTKYRTQLMPLKLKTVLLKHAISQVDLGHAVMQATGTTMNKTGVNLLLNWGEWPKTTPRQSVIDQISAYLRSRGVPEPLIETAFDEDENPIPLLTPGRAVNGLSAVKTPKKEDPEDLFLLEPTMLKPAAKRHFKITFDPFGLEPQSADDVFMGEEQRFVIAALHEAIANNRMVALVGESGSGKSTVWQLITDQIATQGQQVTEIYPRFTEKEKLTGTGILQAIVRDLAPNASLRRSSEMLSRQAHELLAERVADGQRCVLVFEEGHDLSTHAIKQLKRFHEFRTGWKRLMSIVLLAQPELLKKLNRAGGEAREVANRMEIIRMLPLENDLEAYVTHRLARGAIKREAIFAPDALDTVRKVLVSVREGGETAAMTYPLLVGNLLTNAMNIAAELGAPLVDAATVRDAKKRGGA